MTTFVLLMLQPRPVSISLDAVILVLVGVLLLTMALRDLPAPRFTASARTSQTSSMHSPSTEPLPGLDEILSALPFPAALVSPDGQPLSIHAEATHWLEDGPRSRLASPLCALALCDIPRLAPPGIAGIGLDLTRLVAHELCRCLASIDGFGGALCQT